MVSSAEPLAVFLDSRDPKWFNMASTLAINEVARGAEVIVVDVTSLTEPGFGRWRELVFGKESLRGLYKKHLSERGVDYHLLNRNQPKASNPNFSVPSESLNSSLFSLFRTDNKMDVRLWPYLASRLSRTSKITYASVKKFCEKHGVRVGIVPNHRTFTQSTLLTAMQDSGLEVRFYEEERLFPSRMRISSYHIHDLPREAQDFRNFLSKRTPPRVESGRKIIREFLSLSNKNNFSKNLSDDAGLSKIRPFDLIFTSSMDEYWSLGKSWESTWGNQWNFFGALLEDKILSSETAILRIHPNLQNKNGRHVKRELRKLRELLRVHPGIKIIGPLRKTSAEGLIHRARNVAVWNSITGLESLAVGKRVALGAPTFFGYAFGDPIQQPGQVAFASGVEEVSNFLEYRKLSSVEIGYEFLFKQLGWRAKLDSFVPPIGFIHLARAIGLLFDRVLNRSRFLYRDWFDKW